MCMCPKSFNAAPIENKQKVELYIENELIQVVCGRGYSSEAWANKGISECFHWQLQIVAIFNIFSVPVFQPQPFHVYTYNTSCAPKNTMLFSRQADIFRIISVCIDCEPFKREICLHCMLLHRCIIYRVMCGQTLVGWTRVRKWTLFVLRLFPFGNFFQILKSCLIFWSVKSTLFLRFSITFLLWKRVSLSYNVCFSHNHNALLVSRR